MTVIMDVLSQIIWRLVSNGQLHVKNLFPQYDEITGQTSVITLPYNYDDVRAKDIDYQVIGTDH